MSSELSRKRKAFSIFSKLLETVFFFKKKKKGKLLLSKLSKTFFNPPMFSDLRFKQIWLDSSKKKKSAWA